MVRENIRVLWTAGVTGAISLLLAGAASLSLAATSPEKVVVQPGVGPLQEELFQTLIAMHALQDLGYQVKPQKQAKDYAELHKMVADGEVSFIADHWYPLAEMFVRAANGADKISRVGKLVEETTQGYMIDLRTAREHGISNLGQLKDPKIAALFDRDGDGKADLIGCEKNWGCAKTIDHHLREYELNRTVQHVQGDYNKSMTGVAARIRQREPALFYTWTPFWVTSKLRPGSAVRWLSVPYSSIAPPARTYDTTGSDGLDHGFPFNTIHIAANNEFLEANPMAAVLFKEMKIPEVDISDQNQRMQIGENSGRDINRHALNWIAANRALYDRWLANARRAKPS